MLNISNETKEKWINLGILDKNGEPLTVLEMLENGSSYFYLNKKECPYTYDNGNVNSIFFNYSEYKIFSKYLLKYFNIDLNNEFADNYVYFFKNEQVISELGFLMCNIELKKNSYFTSDAEKNKIIREKDQLLKNLILKIEK